MRKFIFLVLISFAFSVLAEDAKMQQLEDDYTNLAKFVMKLSEKVDDLERKVNQKTNAVLPKESVSIQQEINNEKWKNQSAWNNLDNGMTINQVIDILGKPMKSSIPYSPRKVFIYEDGKLKGEVDFYNGKLDGTTPPHF